MSAIKHGVPHLACKNKKYGTEMKNAFMKILEHWRGFSFAVLTLLVTLLCVDVIGIFGGGDNNDSRHRLDESTQVAWQTVGAQGREFLQREYDTVAAEIRSRVDYEHTLFVFKFTLVGGVLYVLFQHARPNSVQLARTEITALVAWAAVAVAALTDLRLMANQIFVITLGTWVRRYEELQLGASAVSLGWETHLSDSLLSRSFYPQLRISSQILTALLFCVAAGIFLLQPYSSDRRAVLASRVGALLSIALMTAAAVNFRRTACAPGMYLAFGIIAAALVLLLLVAKRKET